jgi:hypothetical protein
VRIDEFTSSAVTAKAVVSTADAPLFLTPPEPGNEPFPLSALARAAARRFVALGSRSGSGLPAEEAAAFLDAWRVLLGRMEPLSAAAQSALQVRRGGPGACSTSTCIQAAAPCRLVPAVAGSN